MNMLRSVPKVGGVPDGLSSFEQFKLWVAMNRTPLGTIFASLSAICLAASFEYHAHVAAILAAIGTIVGSAAAGGGAFKSDDYHEERAVAEVRQRSGQFPAYQRRASDGGPRGR